MAKNNDQPNPMEDSFFILKTTVGRFARIPGGPKNFVLIEHVYAESSEALRGNDFKTICFWMYKDEALKVAELIAKTVLPDQDTYGRVTRN